MINMIDLEKYTPIYLFDLEPIFFNKKFAQEFNKELEDLLMLSKIKGNLSETPFEYNNIINVRFVANMRINLTIHLTTRRIVDSVNIVVSDIESKLNKYMFEMYENKKIKQIGSNYFESKNHESKIEMIKALKRHI